MEGMVSLLESSLLLETIEQESWIFGIASLVDWMPQWLQIGRKGTEGYSV